MIAFTMVTSLFAYEPNPKLFEVCYDKLDNCYMISYYEEVEPQYNFNGKRYITVLNTDNVEKDAIFYYENLEASRSYITVLAKSRNEDVDKAKNASINKIPFVTEENFWKISEMEYVYKFTKYMKNIKKQNKNK